MFTYTHIPNFSVGFTYTISGGTTGFGGASTNSYTGGRTEISVFGGISKSASGQAEGISCCVPWTRAASSESSSERISYETNTVKSSLSTSIRASRSWGSTYFNGTSYDVNGISSVSPAPTSSATITIPIAYSSGVDDITFEVTTSSNGTFSQTYLFNLNSDGTGLGTILTGTAPATTMLTGADITSLGLSSVTTLVPFPVLGMASVQRWYVQRENPWGIKNVIYFTDGANVRRVAIAFAATGTSNSPVSRLGYGEQAYQNDLDVGTSSSSTSGGFTGLNFDGGTNNPYTVADGSGFSARYFTAKSAVTNAWGAENVLQGQRVGLYAFNDEEQAILFLDTENSIVGTNVSFSPEVPYPISELVAVAGPVNYGNLYSFSIFTDRYVTENTTFVWSFDESWKLYATSKSNLSDTTSSTYEITTSVVGTASTSPEAASYFVGEFYSNGCTTAILGPIYPFSISGLNILSIYSNFTFYPWETNKTSAFYYGQGTTGTSVSSSSSSISESSSSTMSIGSGSGLIFPYENSALSWAVANVYVSLSTTTAQDLIYPFFGSEIRIPFGVLVIPEIYKASKFNDRNRLHKDIINE